MMMDGQTVRNMKDITQNKYVKRMHLCDFTIGIYYDARTYERQSYFGIIFFVRDKWHKTHCVGNVYSC